MPTKDSFYNIAKELEVAQENEGYLIVIRCELSSHPLEQMQ